MPASMPRRRGSGSSGTARGQGAGCRERRRRWPSGRLPWLLLIRASRGRPGGGGVRRRPPPCTPPVPRSFARHLVRPIQPSEKALNIHGRPGDGWTRQRPLQGAPRRRRCGPERRRRLDLQRPKQARIWSPLSSPISRSRCCPDCCGHPPSPERCKCL